MSVSVRSHLAAGVAALTVSATALAPAVVSIAEPAAAPRVDLAASVKPLVIEPPRPEQIATARAVIERIDPDAQLPPQTAAIVAPAPQNAASNAIVAGYQFIQYWVDYGVQLADYALGFIPYGYLIGDQINIVYFNLVRPISDSVVYGLIVPVVNDPLNIWSYVNGLATVGQTVVNAAINTGIAEFNYFFGWLIPPLPPLPLAAPQATTLKIAELTAAEPATEPAAEAVVVDEHDTLAAGLEADAETTDADAAAEPVDAEPASADSPTVEATEETTEVTDEPVTPQPEADEEKDASTTTTSAGGVQAQGEVRGGGDDKDAKPAEEKPDAAKGGENTDSTTSKPAESDAADPGDAGAKDAEAGTDVTKTKD
jgi:hypothetical protein